MKDLNEGREGVGGDTEPIRDRAALHGSKDPQIVTFAPCQVARTARGVLVEEQTYIILPPSLFLSFHSVLGERHNT